MNIRNNELQLRHAISEIALQEEHTTERGDRPTYTNDIQHQLIEMGFDIELVNKVLLHFEVTSPEMALDYLTQENGRWNHPFVNIEDLNSDKCIVCNDPSRLHRSHFIHRAMSGPIEEININIEKLDIALPRRNISFEPMIVKNNSQQIQTPKFQSNVSEIEIIQRQKVEVTCNICMSQVEESFQSGCQHQFCRECMVDYIKSKIYSSDVEDISCPEGKSKCGNIIGEDVIKNLLEQKDIERYYKFLNRGRIAKIPNAIFCPILDCNSYAIKPAQENELYNNDKKGTDANLIPVFLTCVENNHSFCLKCKQLAHYNSKCDLKFEKEFNKWAGREDVRPCPKCGFYIQKNEGCNHMTCGNKSCTYQFCWVCMGQYQSGHFDNPLRPCFGMQYVNQRNFLVKHAWLRYFKLPLMLLLIVLIFCLVVSFASYLLVGVIMVKFRDKMRESFRGLGKFLKVVIFIGIIFGLGTALLPLGYIIVSIAIAASPFVGLGFLIYYCCRRR